MLCKLKEGGNPSNFVVCLDECVIKTNTDDFTFVNITNTSYYV